jgi:hypothetical protein
MATTGRFFKVRNGETKPDPDLDWSRRRQQHRGDCRSVV